MRVLIIGDTHGGQDIDKLNPQVVKKLGLSNEDIIVHCGDIGVPWIGPTDEMLDYWSSLPCQVVVCLGNHENYQFIESKPVVNRYGVDGYLMAENLFAPKIGSIANIFGKSFWFYPGGYSIDFFYRSLNKSVFASELPLKEDSEAALENLKNHAPVDVIISHDGPREFVMNHFGYPIHDVSDAYLEKVKEPRGKRVHPGFVLDEVMSHPEWYHAWYFGHHHKDFQADKIRCLMNEMILWDIESNNIEIIKENSL